MLGERKRISGQMTGARRRASVAVRLSRYRWLSLDGRARPRASLHSLAQRRCRRGRVLISSWKPGDPVWTGIVDGQSVAVQVRTAANGFVLAHRGIETRAFVYTDREAAAARLMPVKKPPDTGKWLLCPMPGLVRSIDVKEGQEVKVGETLAVVEAMKMENVLRAERDAVVKAIKVKPGDSLAVDAVIMEFA